MRFVLDTNTLVSAALMAKSTPRQAFDMALNKGELLTSESCLAELNQVLHRPKFARYLTPFEADLFINQYSLKATVVTISSSITDCRDLKDNKFLELAIDGIANCIVTGDQDLLVLHPYRALSIVTPFAFLSWVSA
ncbi:putative toxin-antitoxin system toxin component, PIN family [Spirosoma oryzicola]|uniref:putative toxin-antitoxin system toxin component, PIN family n=1 Tax=Spirosoma oryzicola TaxID=2898794 RepID=UPI001E610D01|nr:putative toxin-antitoxin system toxin component, PIN family [Spirosoma oryzicola]UHG94974.1 putative toxin-antitoxin system toxin component, PIN family [Spirosoma oryzicola]